MGLWMREIERKGNMFPQRVLGDSFNVYLRLLIERMENHKNVFMTSKFFIFINLLYVYLVNAL